MSQRRSRVESRQRKAGEDTRAEVPRQGGRRERDSAAPHRTVAASAPLARSAPTLQLAPLLIPLLLIGAGIAAYHNSFSGVFLLDDKIRIVANSEIRQLWPPWISMAHNTRPIVYLSIAFNYALSGLDVWGYHAFNLAVHLLAGLVLFGIVRRTLDSEPLRARYGQAAPWLAGTIALIWVVHPLQTESVTYVIQRAESMMGLFFMLTLYCGLRGAASSRPRAWYAASVVACALGMGSKESMFVAPLVMLLYDRCFIAGSFGGALRQRTGLYIGLAATWIMLAILIATSRVDEQVNLVESLTAWRYALTQFGVIVHYLRLAFWPQSLVLDYAWPPAESVSAILPPAAIVLALLASTGFALYRRHWLGFWGGWFFLTLGPTSSILPIADIAFEHRMYLPLAAVVVVFVIGAYELLQLGFRRLGAPVTLRWGLHGSLAAAAVVLLIVATVRRNEDYRSDFAMWTDIVTKRPDNPRARYNLGNAYDRQGKTAEAIAQYVEALRVKPDYVDAHVNLGAARLARNELNDAVAHLSEAVRLKPNSAEARNNLGAALFSQGRVNDAVPHLRENVRLTPHSASAHYNLAAVLMTAGALDEAIEHYATAVRIEPRYARAHNDWGSVLMRQGKLDEAIEHFAAASKIDPEYTEARNNLAIARQAKQKAN